MSYSKLLSIAIFVMITGAAQAQYLRVYYPDIEQGAATLVVSPTGQALLVDAGTGMNDTDMPIETFINELIEAGVIVSLDYIVATHYDEDHIGRMENVFQLVDLPTGIVTYDRGSFGSTPSTFAYGDYEWQANLHNRTTITANTTINLGGGVTVRCYVVNGELPDGTSVDLTGAGQFENAVSVGLVVRYGDTDIWIGGDLVDNPTYDHPPVETAVAPFIGDMDIYTVNHHGSKSTSSNAAFLASIKAEVAINQNSADNSHGHPNADIVSRFLSTADTAGNTPKFFQTNPGDPDDTRSDDSLADGIADPDDVDSPLGIPGNIAIFSDGSSYMVFGGAIEPYRRAADSGSGTVADFPPAILQTDYSPLVPTAAETVIVSAEVRDEGAVTVNLHYNVDGVTQTPIAMSKVTGTNRYEGTIPAQLDGALVTFYVAASDSLAQSEQSLTSGYFSGTTDIADLRIHDTNGVLETKGLSARIQGNITAEPGIFHPNVSQIYVQDATGGLNIFDNDLLTLSRGDLVTFVGEVGQFGGVAQINTAESIGNYGYSLDSSGTVPTPQLITVSQVGESLEGKLVRIDGVTVTTGEIPVTGNGNLTITDDNGVSTTNIRVDQDTDIAGANTPVGSFDIIGIVSQYDSSVPYNYGYQILPRERTDFVSDEVNHPDLVIAEIHADPDATNGDANGDGSISSSEDEFVEIVNTSMDDVDISGWTISDGIGVKFTFPASTVLPAREATVVFGGGTPNGDFGNAGVYGLVFTAGSLGLNNSGDTVTLRDDANSVVQAVTYGSEGGDNQSLVRDPDWSNAPLVKHTTTSTALRYSPGTRTDGKAFTLAPGKLFLSEVMYDPSGSDSDLEWIELYNASSETIDLSEVSIGAGGGDYTSVRIQLSGTIAAGATFVVGGPTTSGDNANPSYDQVYDWSPNLQNSGTTADGVALFNVTYDRITGTTVPIDTVVYGTSNDNSLMDNTGAVSAVNVGDASGGQTLERTNLFSGWQIQMTPTPNTSNLGSAGSGYGPASDVVLSEVFFNASGSDGGLEWIELYNKGSQPVDLSSMSLGWGGSDYTYGTAALSGVIQPGATLVIGGPTSSSSNANPTFDQVLNFSPDLQNAGSTADGVALFDVLDSQITSSTIPIDAVIYGTTNSSSLIDESGTANSPDVGTASAGDSIERTDLAGTWQTQSSPTPNSTNL